MKCKSWRFACLLLFGIFLVGELHAASGKLSGRVYDKQTGEPLPGANVMITHLEINEKMVPLDDIMGAACGEDGYYFILNIPPGTYTVSASMVGYAELKKEGVRVNIDRTITVDFPLEQTVLEMQSVTVMAEREVIRHDVASSQEIISADRIDAVPVMRMDEFIGTMKGIELVASDEGTGLSIRGGEIRETDVQIDGISSRDPRSGNAYLSINASSVEEMQVLTGGFEAKYGGFRSGLVNIVTKEGSRDRYSFAGNFNLTPAGQKRYFGQNPWDEDFIIYRIFADTTENGWAYIGTRGDTTGLVPPEFQTFRGWNNSREGNANYEIIGLNKKKLTPEQKQRLWLIQHPTNELFNEPDFYLEGTLTGPVPGAWIPILGDVLERSTFMLAGKYEQSQFAYPIGPRDTYVDWNTHLKITTRLTQKTKVSVNAMYARVETNSSNRPSTAGGVLQDNTLRYGYLNNNNESTNQQARILGSNLENMFNRSRLMYLDQNWFLGGVKINHTLSPRSFFTLEAQVTYQDHDVYSMSADTTDSGSWVELDSGLYVLNFPSIGTPNASTNWGKDITDYFWIFGGLQNVDSSYSINTSIKGDYKAQLGRNHELETGFLFNYTYSKVYAGTWLQSKKMYTPDTWQYYTITPIEAAVYIQDKMEFEGLIAMFGLRGDYFNPMRKSYQLSHPFDLDYPAFYNVVYESIPGEWGSYERWKVFRDMLKEPPGWPTTDVKSQFKVSPRLGVSYPIAVGSKMYFNYGHFYQRPAYSFLYNQSIAVDYANIPSPELTLGKTVSYEFGYEQQMFRQFLFNIVLYYKDVKNDPLPRTYVNYWEDFVITKYYPDAFSDARGIELRFEKNYGKWFTFWANFDYMLKSWGQSGMRYVYENQVTAREASRSANISTVESYPKSDISMTFHSPQTFGVPMAGVYPFGGWHLNFRWKWSDAGDVVIKQDMVTGEQFKADAVDYTNLDAKITKDISIGGVTCNFGVTVFNVLNQKRLYISGMNSAQYSRYLESLKFSFEEGDEHGNDKWGEWNKEHIDTGWFEAPIFLNPRRIVASLSFSF
ncbi:MAG: carboxypeptidase regulatory-like domain-containing protein [Candidatus Marinimicrobia bacterium]|nr:carboxypeptidase regulatory-like domain-containing protein [Candidatus Neomarinimicrobiota bacterium]